MNSSQWLSPHDLHSTNGKMGFTLTELLVTCAVLLILGSFLLPATLKVRMRANSTECLNNGKQIATAWNLYSQDHGDNLTPNVDGMLGGFTNWVAGNMAFESDSNDRSLLIDSERSLLAPYVRQATIFKCPSDGSTLVRSVSMNCRLNPVRDPAEGAPRWIGDGGGGYRVFRKNCELLLCDNIFVVLDENSRFLNDGYFAVDMSNTGTPSGVGVKSAYYMIDYPAAYHSRGATVSFADGHAVLHRWSDESTFKNITPRAHVPAPARDAKWLQEHCTNP